MPKSAAYLAVREILQKSRVTQILDFLRSRQQWRNREFFTKPLIIKKAAPETGTAFFCLPALYTAARRGEDLNIVIQKKLVRMGPQLNGVDFFFHLVFDPSLNYIFGKYIAFQQEFMVIGQTLKGLFQ